MDNYEVFQLHCKSCLYKWDEIANSVTEDRFVFTSRKNYLAAMIIFKNPFFNEISSLIDDLSIGSSLNKIDIAGVFHEVLGKISDPAPDGTHYSMMTDYVCPKCGSDKISYGPKNPPEFQFMDLTELPHKYWDTLNDKEKKELIKKYLK